MFSGIDCDWCQIKCLKAIPKCHSLKPLGDLCKGFPKIDISISGLGYLNKEAKTLLMSQSIQKTTVEEYTIDAPIVNELNKLLSYYFRVIYLLSPKLEN